MSTIALRHLLDPGRPLTYGIVQAGPNVEGGVPYIRPTDMLPAHGVIDEGGLLRTSREIAGAYARASIDEGDVVLSIGPSFGKVMVVPRSLKGANLTQGTARLAPNTDTDSRWLYWVLQSSTSISFWNSVVAGGTFRALNLGPLGETPVRRTPLTEQRRIADFLDDRVSRIDRIIAARREQLALAQQVPWTTFGIDIEGAPRVPVRRAIRSMADGPFGSAFSSADYVDSGPAVIRLGNIGFAEFRDAEVARVPKDIYAKFPLTHVSPGELLIASLGDGNNHAGRACVAPASLGTAMVKGKCFRATAEPEVASEEFLAILLSSPVGADGLVQQGTGATRSMLNFERLKSCELPMPSRNGQDEVVAQFLANKEAAERTANTLRTSAELLTEYKSSLITAAVTGELDVTTAGSNIPG